MSTILKALKRSEATRPRDAALPLGRVPDGAGARRRGPRWGLWISLTVILAAAGLAGWLLGNWPGDREQPRGWGSHIAEVSLPERAAPADDVAPDDGPGKSSPGQAPASNAPEADSVPASDGAAPDGGGGSESAPAAESAADGASSPPVPADPVAPEPRPELDQFALLPRLRDLPPARRDQLPALTLNAHVYAPEPAQRFVLINLSRYGEGDRVAPGLTVAAIYPGGVVLEDDQGRFVLSRP